MAPAANAPGGHSEPRAQVNRGGTDAHGALAGKRVSRVVGELQRASLFDCAEFMVAAGAPTALKAQQAHASAGKAAYQRGGTKSHTRMPSSKSNRPRQAVTSRLKRVG